MLKEKIMGRTITPKELQENIERDSNILILDVRRTTVYEADKAIIPGVA